MLKGRMIKMQNILYLSFFFADGTADYNKFDCGCAY